MDSKYTYTEIEPKILQLWDTLQIANPDARKRTKSTKSFSIIMPPPNANDPIHIGHAMFVAIEDTLTRYHRMLGEDTLWLPGTDHAGIETQYVFEKKLAKQKQSRFDFDRETLYQKIFEYVQENSDIAVSQIKRLGASADWTRFKFTLDEDVVSNVLETFKSLHKNGLVYRDLQLVNYCTKCGTSYSDLEINHEDRTTPLYYIKYRFQDTPQKTISIATVRPEPIFADTHLAVHPNDHDKKHLIGKVVLNPLTDQPMPIIGDSFVDPEFGTGVVKLTPAHDPNDFAVAKAHNLPIVPAISNRGKILENGGKYAGLSATKAREQVIIDLQKKQLIEKIDEKYSNRISTCYRCGRVIEPLPLPQFFVRVKSGKQNLVKNIEKMLDDNDTSIHGAGREKILRNWLSSLKDWNISRQIVWGIRIPVWYKIDGYEDQITATFLEKSGKTNTGTLAELLKNHTLEEIKAGLQTTTAEAAVPYILSITPPTEAQHYFPETDTFDTWFSSSQWPVVTLQTNQPDDFKRFYPTTVMETGYDILLFWVMRMMLMGSYLTDTTPFKHVYLHGLIRDDKGQKMSKSKGNVINPLTVVDEFGADALRMALVIRSTPGIDKSIGKSDFKAARNLTNKVWNASRFIISRSQDQSLSHTDLALPADTQESEFFTQLNQTITDVSTQLDKLQIGLAADTLYSAFWHWYCDECIEHVKLNKLSTQEAAIGLIQFLKLLHPFTPFVTEAVWQELRAANLVTDDCLALSTWPTTNPTD